MADWSALTRGFQQGAEFSQNFRERRQIEKAREFALKKMGQEDFLFDDNQKRLGERMESEFGVSSPVYEHEGMKDPLAFRLMDWFKKRRQKQTPTVDVGELEFEETPPPAETALAATSEPMAFADGGDVEDPEKVRQRAAQNRERRPGSVQQQTERVQGADRTAKTPRQSALSKADDAAGRFSNTRPLPNEQTGWRRAARGARNAGRMVKGAGAAGALAGTALTTATTPTEQYRERFGMETDDPSLMGDIGVRALGAASDLANVATFGAAGKLYRDLQPGEAPAAPMPELQEPAPAEGVDAGVSAAMSSRSTALDSAVEDAGAMTIDFAQMDVDPEEVPNMVTEDWVQHRIDALRAAQLKGIDPTTAREQVNDQINRMQQKGFLAYAQQGLMLMEAGNDRGAMAALRAAYQYMPNGFDVEFGTVNQGGKQVIVGFGKDEKTGQRVPGTEMLMVPERLSTMIENFTNPQAFRAWKKDEQEFDLRERGYEEVTKPLAEMQGNAALMNAETSQMRAQADLMGASGTEYKQSDMRGDAAIFREAPGLQEMLLQDPPQAQYLLNVMGRIKQARPNIPPDAVASAVMNAVQQGNLEQWLQRLGVPGQGGAEQTPRVPTAQAAPRSALGASPTARTSQPAASAGRPPGFPDAVWNNALRDNGGDPRRAAASLSGYNEAAP